MNNKKQVVIPIIQCDSDVNVTQLGQEQLAFQPARTTRAAAACTSAASAPEPSRNHAPHSSQPFTVHQRAPVSHSPHSKNLTRQCQRSVMVQCALIDLNTDNGDAKPFANLGIRPTDSLDDLRVFRIVKYRKKLIIPCIVQLSNRGNTRSRKRDDSIATQTMRNSLL